MKGWKITILLVLIALTATGCSVQIGTANSPGGVDEAGDGPIITKSWIEIPIPIYISNSVPEEFREDILNVFDMWNKEAGKELFVYEGLSDSNAREFDGSNVVYWDENPHPNRYFAETHYAWINGDELIESDVVFYGDPDDFDVLSCQGEKLVCKSSVMKKDITTTALHEIGHMLGFEHSAEPHNIMNPNFTISDVNQDFSEDLIAELTAEYNS